MRTVRLAILCAVGLLLALPAISQQDQGQPGQPGPGGGNRGGGMRGLVTGTVAKVDAAAGVVEVKRDDGTIQQVSVPAGTQIMRNESAPVTGLKAGDRVSVTGTPTAITATQIRLSDAQAPQGGPTPPGANAAPPPQGPSFGGRPDAGSSMVGGTFETFYQGSDDQKKKNESVFSIKLDDKTQVFVVANPKTVLQKTVTVALSGVKVGEKIMAMGQPDANGVTQARRLSLGEGGPGGFGGFGGQGGPGGQHGFGNRGSRQGGRNHQGGPGAPDNQPAE